MHSADASLKLSSAATSQGILDRALPQTYDKIAFVVHLLGGGDPESSFLGQDEEAILSGRCGDWRAFFFPVRQQFSQSMGLQDIA